MAIACNIDGSHEIRRDGGPWHEIAMSIPEAESALNPKNDHFGRARVKRARRFRENKEAR